MLVQRPSPLCEAQLFHIVIVKLCDMRQKCMTALDKAWHPEHFCCMMCGRLLGDESGFHEHDGQPYCEYASSSSSRFMSFHFRLWPPSFTVVCCPFHFCSAYFVDDIKSLSICSTFSISSLSHFILHAFFSNFLQQNFIPKHMAHPSVPNCRQPFCFVLSPLLV